MWFHRAAGQSKAKPPLSPTPRKRTTPVAGKSRLLFTRLNSENRENHPTPPVPQESRTHRPLKLHLNSSKTVTKPTPGRSLASPRRLASYPNLPVTGWEKTGPGRATAARSRWPSTWSLCWRFSFNHDHWLSIWPLPRCSMVSGVVGVVHLPRKKTPCLRVWCRWGHVSCTKLLAAFLFGRKRENEPLKVLFLSPVNVSSSNSISTSWRQVMTAGLHLPFLFNGGRASPWVFSWDSCLVTEVFSPANWSTLFCCISVRQPGWKETFVSLFCTELFTLDGQGEWGLLQHPEPLAFLTLLHWRCERSHQASYIYTCSRPFFFYFEPFFLHSLRS